MMKRMLISIAILAIAAGAFAHGLVAQNAKIAFDKDNYLIFEDVGRQPNIFGVAVRIHVYRDGKQEDIDLVDPQYTVGSTRWKIVAPRTVAVKYKDRDNVWFVDESHTGQRCVLYNLVERKVVRKYWGLQIEISPDGRNVATVAEDFRDTKINPLNGYLAFISDTMVFPFLEPGFSKWDKFSTPLEQRIKKADGTTAADFLRSKPAPQGYLEPLIAWTDSDSVVFQVKDRQAATTGTLYRVTGLADLGSSRTLTIRTHPDGAGRLAQSVEELRSLPNR